MVHAWEDSGVDRIKPVVVGLIQCQWHPENGEASVSSEESGQAMQQRQNTRIPVMCRVIGLSLVTAILSTREEKDEP
jgi:hypothetical protein